MDLSLEKLREAVSLREQIQALEERIERLFGSAARPRQKVGGGRRRRPMSAETRAKLAASAKARWAARNDNNPSAKKTTKRRNGLTAAGRKKLSDSMKARWAARRKAGN